MKVIIAGAGIGGLTAALALHRVGIEPVVLESVDEIRPLGVGINVLPHSIKILDRLGLLDQLLATGIETKDLLYFTSKGQEVWCEPRGIGAGYRWPQLCIHRGELQMLLLRAVQDRIGPQAVRTGHHFVRFEDTGGGVAGHFASQRNGDAELRITGDVLIGADGIHSRLRKILYPNEGPPNWTGGLMYRAVCETEPFLSGRSVFMAGGRQRFLAYPISKPHLDRGGSLTNWVARFFVDPTKGYSRQDWNNRCDPAAFLPMYESWKFDWFDVPAVIRATEHVYEYPLVDRDPLPRWSYGRVTLLGDAAHPMYPWGSNGASQAILDADAIASALHAHADPKMALGEYDRLRRQKTAEIVLSNRRGGPESVIQLVEERAPGGFANLHSVVSPEELAQVAETYKRVAGFDLATVNS